MSGFTQAILGLITFRCLIFGHKFEYRADRKEHLCSRCMEAPPPNLQSRERNDD